MPISEQHKGAAGKLFEFARNLRKRQTAEEELLWKYLNGRKLLGYKFRRQHPLYNFILDFYCHEAGLVIELDGDVHDEVQQKEYDRYRTIELEEFKLTVIRFRNEEVKNNIQLVLEKIKMHLIPGPSPKRRREE